MSGMSIGDYKFTPPDKIYYRSLLVDDEDVPRRVLGGMLKSAGYTQIEEAASARQALEKLRDQEYHLVFVDKNMPGGDGFEVLREGKKLWPDAEFIMITAFGSMEAACQAMELGAASFLQKPFPDLQGVLRRVEVSLGRVNSRLENRYLLQRARELLIQIDASEEKLKELSMRVGETPRRGENPQEAVRRLENLASSLHDLMLTSQLVSKDIISLIRRELLNIVDLLGSSVSYS